MPALGTTGLDVFGLCLGGNVFGWTADEEQSFAVLDAYAAAGGNFIDTANQYSFWAPGNDGGVSETIIGNWMKARGNRSSIVLATKVGGEMPGLPHDLRASTIERAVDESLARLQTDYIDLYYAHFDDAETPLEETLGAFDALVKAGKVRAIAASNHPVERLADALDVSAREGFAAYAVYQPRYNLLEREFEAEHQPLLARKELAAIPYWTLAQGYLLGKYRPGAADADSPRAGEARAFEEKGGVEMLAVLDALAAEYETGLGPIVLAWTRSRDTVVAPIASARTPEQLSGLLPFIDLEIAPEDLDRLDRAVAAA
ncbi:MAG: aldo/keto reductase [Solirubrobacteraceae bacterium]|nr:aldo/keto reductase [Solirubrobacteraceae bacterium]